jgi:lysophospholipase L1-like esterase
MRRGVALLVALLGLALLAACSALPSAAPTPTATPARPAIDVPADARAYFFGDSWTEGQVARRGRGFPYVTSELLGWTAEVDGVGGTGYIRARRPSTQTYPVRAAAIPVRAKADIVIVEGGLNDEGGDLTLLKPAVRRTVDALQARFPGKPLVVLGPAPRSLPVPADLKQIDLLIRDECRDLGVLYISPIEREWITGLNFRDIIDPASHHPSTAGHAYLGGRLAVALQDLMERPQDTDVPSGAELKRNDSVG